MSKSLDKIVAQDVHDYALAEMFFGPGAGTRRKLVRASVEQKFATIPEYAEKFNAAFAGVDQTKMAELALKERKRLDRAATAGKNLRAIKSGNLRNASTGVALIFGAVWLAHETGYDKVIETEARAQWSSAKLRYRDWKAGRGCES